MARIRVVMTLETTGNWSADDADALLEPHTLVWVRTETGEEIVGQVVQLSGGTITHTT